METTSNTDYGGGRSQDDDSFKMYCYKILPCPNKRQHDWKRCPLAHEGEEVTRRDPRKYPYMPVVCEFRRQSAYCPRGESCPFTHNVFELWLHPDKYKTTMCRDGMSCRRRVCFFAHRPDEMRAPSPAAQPPPPVPQQQQGMTLLSTGPNQARLVPAGTPIMQPMHAAAQGGTTFIQQSPSGPVSYQIQHPTMVLAQPGMGQQAMVLQPVPGQPGGYALVPATAAGAVTQTTISSNRPGRVMMPMQRSTARAISVPAPGTGPGQQPMVSQAMMLQPGGPQHAGLTYGSSMLQPVQVQYGTSTLHQVAEAYPMMGAQDEWNLEAYEDYAPAEGYQQYVMAPQPVPQQQWQMQQVQQPSQQMQQMQQMQPPSSSQLPHLMPAPQLLPVMPGTAVLRSDMVQYGSLDGSPSSISSGGPAHLPQHSSPPQLGSSGAEDPALLSRLQALLTPMDQAVEAERGSMG